MVAIVFKMLSYLCIFVGIDYILAKRNGTYTPIGIEVNSHDCTINCQLYEFMNPDLAGQSVGPLVQTMCERSQKYAVWGKVVVVIAAGGSSKKFIWPAAKKDNIQVVDWIISSEFIYCCPFLLSVCTVCTIEIYRLTAHNWQKWKQYSSHVPAMKFIG